jgi:hypothetical protein
MRVDGEQGLVSAPYYNLQIGSFNGLCVERSTLDWREEYVAMRKPIVLIVAGILVICIIGAFFVSKTLGFSAIIGGVFFMIVFGIALSRPPLQTEDELYESYGEAVPDSPSSDNASYTEQHTRSENPRQEQSSNQGHEDDGRSAE